MSPTTSATLLKSLRDGNAVSWEAFFHTYRPLIRSRCHERFGFSPAECDELVQRVMLVFFEKGQSFVYDRTKGKFRNYLRRVVDLQSLKFLEQRRSRWEVAAGSDLEMVEQTESDQTWEFEWRDHVMAQAFECLRRELPEQHFQAFDLYVVQEIAASEVSAMLGISVDQVYLIKHRAVRKLQNWIGELEE